MKKTDLAKNQGLVLAHRLKNAAKKKNIKANEAALEDKKELAKKNPLLASLIRKA
jgi:hypothetical protein